MRLNLQTPSFNISFTFTLNKTLTTATTTTTTAAAMSSSKSDESKTPDQNSTSPSPKTQETQNQEQKQDQEQDQENEEEGECGFCLFMKGGGCKETFIKWENCIEEGEKNKEDIVDKCFEATSALKKCMEANADYYGPILQAEKAAEQAAINQLNKEKQAAAAAAVGNESNDH
ncbi:hypothetical protein QVD17_21130 [Tagetes erecta]|uniref:GCK domain-containing protein n=1 Tax=Tagetes erecta TaxID=13708 RepID=A0AAD8KSY5_TARER|nr:hypothetical protein QVD17_21130 [Tagetes erecta]